ncbi:MAG: aldo/keto reductase [Eubacteriales bacterium]
MNQRMFGKTGVKVSEIGLGTWQLGGRWGEDYDQKKAESILRSAVDHEINFFDTADVYNGGESEKSIGQFLKNHKNIFVVTKAGRQLNPHTSEMYTPQALEGFVEDSLKRLDVECLNMVLLHCPPTPVYQKDDVFTALDKMKSAGKIAHFGVSIEKVSEGIMAMKDYPIAGVEVIFNMFRLKPLDEFLALAEEKQVGTIIRVPLASGLLTGNYHKDSSFGAGDHRTYNRQGEAFDKGETFSGVDYGKGLEAVTALKELFGTEELAPIALRWILMHPQVSTVIPGASSPQQMAENAKATLLPPLTPEQMDGVKAIYEKYLKDTIHPQW